MSKNVTGSAKNSSVKRPIILKTSANVNEKEMEHSFVEQQEKQIPLEEVIEATLQEYLKDLYIKKQKESQYYERQIQDLRKVNLAESAKRIYADPQISKQCSILLQDLNKTFDSCRSYITIVPSFNKQEFLQIFKQNLGLLIDSFLKQQKCLQVLNICFRQFNSKCLQRKDTKIDQGLKELAKKINMESSKISSLNIISETFIMVSKTVDEIRKCCESTGNNSQSILEQLLNNIANLNKQNEQLNNHIITQQQDLVRIRRQRDTAKSDLQSIKLSTSGSQSCLLDKIKKIQKQVKEYQIKNQQLTTENTQVSRRLEQQQSTTFNQRVVLAKCLNQILSKVFKRELSLSPNKLKQQIQRYADDKLLLSQIGLTQPNKLQASSQIFQKFTKQQSQILIRAVEEQKFGRNIVKIKLLYAMDLVNKVNFHQYIDGKPDILLVAELQTGYVVAGFSQQPVNQLHSPGHGFLYSITNDVKLTISRNAKSKNPKVISPDSQYIVFGNSEFRIKAGEKIAFSNLGVNNCYFNSQEKNFTVQGLLGNDFADEDKKRTVGLVKYQFYQVFFNN